MDDSGVRHGDLAKSVCATFVVDRAKTILTWNLGAETLLGRKADAAIGRKCYDVIGGRLPSGKRLCRSGCGVRTRAHRKSGVPDFDLICQDGWGQHRVLKFSTIGLPAAGNSCTVHVMRPATSRLDRRTTATKLAKHDHWSVTRREADVLRALTDGGSTSDIARGLCISPLTVRTHVRNLLRKHNLHSRAQLIIFAMQNGAPSI